MDSKTEGNRKSHSHAKSKKSGPAAPPPPEPLQPMKLPPAHASSDGPPDTQENTPETSLAKRLMSTVVDDGDVIEKNWVDKARKIAEAYSNDPHRQSEELSILRANYMDKQFGKIIKLSK